MYDVMVYDSQRGQYVPAKDEKGKALSFTKWVEAAEMAEYLNAQGWYYYTVEYHAVRRPRRRTL